MSHNSRCPLSNVPKMDQIIGQLSTSHSSRLCHSCERLLRHISRDSSPEEFESYHACSRGCSLCAYFWNAARQNDSLKWVIGETALIRGRSMLGVALNRSPNQDIACISLDAIHGDMVFQGEKIMLSTLQGGCFSGLSALITTEDLFSYRWSLLGHNSNRTCACPVISYYRI
jgi:hypothetical protein